MICDIGLCNIDLSKIDLKLRTLYSSNTLIYNSHLYHCLYDSKHSQHEEDKELTPKFSTLAGHMHSYCIQCYWLTLTCSRRGSVNSGVNLLYTQTHTQTRNLLLEGCDDAISIFCKVKIEQPAITWLFKYTVLTSMPGYL